MSELSAAQQAAGVSVNLRPGWEKDSIAIFGEIQALTVKLKVFEAMREQLPFLDRAIDIRTLLDGWVTLDEDETDPRAFEVLSNFDECVPLAHMAVGFQNYVGQMRDQADELGFSVGEMVPGADDGGVAYLQIARSTTIAFMRDPQTNLPRLAQRRFGGGTPKILEGVDWLDYLTGPQHKGHPQGYPLAFSLPEVADVMVRVGRALRNNWWRFGSPRFHFHYKGEQGTGEQTLKNRADALKKAAIDALQAEKAGNVVDLFTYGGSESAVNIEIWGMVKDALAAGDSWKIMAEQLVAKTGLPAWMLGLHWQATYQLTTRQADFLIAEVEQRRKTNGRLIRRTFDRVLALYGLPGARYRFAWDTVNLQDAVEWARAQNLEANAEKNRAAAAQIYAQMQAEGHGDIVELMTGKAGKKGTAADPLDAYQGPGIINLEGDARTAAVDTLIQRTIESRGISGMKLGGFPREIHRNPKIEKLMDELTEAMIAQARVWVGELLRIAGLPSEGAIERWAAEQELKGVPDGDDKGTKGPRMPTNAEIDRVFAEWAGSLTGEGLPAAELIDAIYPAHTVRGMATGTTHAHEQLAAMVRPAGVELAPRIPLGTNMEFVRGFVKRGQKLITNKLTVTFKETSKAILKQGLSEGRSGYQIGYQLWDKIGHGADWHWDRLARSELSMAHNLGSYAEGVNQGCEYEKWLTAGGACELCAGYEGQVWKLGQGPRPVSDTHPNCQCDLQTLWVYEGNVMGQHDQQVPYPAIKAMVRAALDRIKGLMGRR